MLFENLTKTKNFSCVILVTVTYVSLHLCYIIHYDRQKSAFHSPYVIILLLHKKYHRDYFFQLL